MTHHTGGIYPETDVLRNPAEAVAAHNIGGMGMQDYILEMKGRFPKRNLRQCELLPIRIMDFESPSKGGNPCAGKEKTAPGNP